MSRSNPRRLTLGASIAVVSALLGLAAAFATASAVAAGSATTTAATTTTAPPKNTQRPTLSGRPVVGATLTASNGTWTGSGLTFVYRFLRCDKSGGGCYSGSTTSQNTYKLTSADAGNTVRVRVTATNSAGSASATSAPTAVVTHGGPPANGCPSGTGVIQAAQLSSPAQLSIDRQDVSPFVIGRSTQQIQVRFHVSACNGRDVQGALVYVTAVPFQQFSIPPETPTGADGWASLSMTRLGGFPAAAHQQLLVLFVRARQPGNNVLAGLSARRLVSFRVDLSR
ncbi:MAG TPA: hypothetical protein VE982_01375 [Gaiellaceae bacterium]|nr:hypothetical protein [Gaiellaceae bacterium]